MKLQLQHQHKDNLISPQEIQNLLDAHALNANTVRRRILLIDGNIPVDSNAPYKFGSKKSSGYTPLGLNRIKAYLNSKKIDCDIKSIEEVSQEEISKYDIIGINSLSPSIPYVFEFAKRTKDLHPDKIILGGGEHFGLDSKWILENKNLTGLDACCTMQGELPLLALSLGVPLQRIGSIDYHEKGKVVSNIKYPRLNDFSHLEVLTSSPVIHSQTEAIVMPEIAAFFSGSGSTQTNSGCNHACTFCTNGQFYGKAVSTIETAKKEIESIQKSSADFMYVRDPMLNVNPEHLKAFVEYMQQINDEKDKKLAWFSFMSVTNDLPDFSKMAKAGSLMIGVGLEDVVGDRCKLGKGNQLSVATKFVEAAKEHLLVRALLLVGLPNHYQVKKEEIKETMLDYMKSHPQAAYRINILTPTPGTLDYKIYADALIDDPHNNPAFFRKFDHLHSIVDPKKMREKLGIAELNEDSSYVQTPQEWEELRNEITSEYLNSTEHAKYLESLKGKEFLGRPDLLYNIAIKFKKVNENCQAHTPSAFS